MHPDEVELPAIPERDYCAVVEFEGKTWVMLEAHNRAALGLNIAHDDGTMERSPEWLAMRDAAEEQVNT